MASATAIAGFAALAASLTDRYNAIPNDLWYAPVRHLIPAKPIRVLDIGTGTGRDAIWFANLGHEVTALDPVAAFVEPARKRDARITWLVDALPDLPHALALCRAFDLLVLNGVWQHLDMAERRHSAPVLSRLAAPDAILLMALRHGPAPEGRPVIPIDADETEGLFAAHGFAPRFRRTVPSIQPANIAAGVTWTWLAFAKDTPE